MTTRTAASLLGAILCATTACGSTQASKLPAEGIEYTGFDSRSGRFSVGAGERDGRPGDPLLMDVKKAWATLPQAYASVGLTPNVVDPAAMIVGVQGLVVHKPIGGERLSRLLDCGVDVTGPNADYYEIHLTVMTGVRAADDGTSTVSTRIAAWAAANGQSSNVRCGSTGRLEEKIAQAMGLEH